MKFIIGIGNPGTKYQGTRHNIGFEVLDGLAASMTWKKNAKLDAWVAEGLENVLLIKPLTFVNLSGQTIRNVLKYKEAKPEDFLAVCDDVNLPFGRMRLREKGSAGGHHGLESLIEALDSQSFPRLRLGVANSAMPKDLSGFVLGTFNPGEKKDLKKILESAVSVCKSWAEKDFNSAQNQLSQKQQKE